MFVVAVDRQRDAWIFFGEWSPSSEGDAVGVDGALGLVGRPATAFPGDTVGYTDFAGGGGCYCGCIPGCSCWPVTSPADLAGVVAMDATSLADAGMVTVVVADLADAGTAFPADIVGVVTVGVASAADVGMVIIGVAPLANAGMVTVVVTDLSLVHGEGSDSE